MKIAITVPAHDSAKHSRPPTQNRYLTEDDVSNLAATLKPNHQLAINLMRTTGLRPGNVLAIRVCDIHTDDTIHPRISRNSNANFVPAVRIPAHLRTQIAAALARSTGPNDRLIVSRQGWPLTRTSLRAAFLRAQDGATAPYSLHSVG